jgi:pyruvate, water dikinase
MAEVSTGIVDLDRMIGGLLPGDNVVWTVDEIDAYLPFADALAAHACGTGEELVYFRFADHAPVFTPGPGIEIHDVHPEPGFESFITEIHRTIGEHGCCRYYVFDSLSSLSNTCYSDRMIGNFFRLTCPLLRRLDTIAYFAMYRSLHSYHATALVRDTTQILIDVYRLEGQTYVRPVKILGRQTAERTRMHLQQGNAFLPLASSAHISRVLGSAGWSGLPTASYRMIGVWDRTFLRAEQVADACAAGTAPAEEATRTLREVVRLIITNDDRMCALAERYLTLPDVIAIWKRMIGTGMIGGKAVGMMLARAILERADPRWGELLEPHDSFYIGSDVYYTFLVTNDCWWERQRQKDPGSYLEGNDAVRERLLSGTFPDYIMARFVDLLDYFGQSPIIVRSSSLLEDNFGNAFSGKYESVFCVNQGGPEERLAEFLNAVRRIYASTMSEEALTYRALRGVLGRDEQMALLVQRVSGVRYGRYLIPELAGVAYSFNPYAWSREIEPHAGMLRLVFGLGTRAVDRSDDDYTRVVSLSAPHLRPDASANDRRRHAQRRVDVLDVERNEFRQLHFLDVAKNAPEIPVERFAVRDPELARMCREQRLDERGAWVLTLDPALEKTPLASDMRAMLGAIRDAYGTDVDVEFTVNHDSEAGCTINVLQCRPLQVRGTAVTADPPPRTYGDGVIMRSAGGVIGHSRSIEIARLVYVVPHRYAALPENKRYALARLIGRLTRTPGLNTMLIGPGRWGTSTPSLGIPVSFPEIHGVSVLCEIDVMHEGLVPDLSLGTHFFNDLVEENILYVGHFCGNPENVLNDQYLCGDRTALERLAPDAAEWRETVYVRDGAAAPDGAVSPGDPALRAADGAVSSVRLYADALAQVAVLYTTP